jgi:hypothetical protein
VRALTENEYLRSAEPSLRQLFLEDDPRLTEFGESAEVRKVLYEYLPPEDEMTSALLAVASKMGDEGFFFSNLNRNRENKAVIEHWWIPFDEASLYLSRRKDTFGDIYQLENVIYSPKGKWGVIHSFEHFGLLAGTKEYIRELVKTCPEIDRQVHFYLEYIHEYILSDPATSFPWVRPFIERAFGKEEARNMLTKAHLL